ncbi:unnamed protein product [Calypogeia fissa]
MASTKTVLAVAVLLLAVVVVECAQCPPVTDFASCLPYVNSPNAKNPSKSDPCCKLVNTMTADCLCNAAKNPNPLPGINVDFKKALTLPKTCGRYVPPHTTCNGTPVPGR